MLMSVPCPICLFVLSLFLLEFRHSVTFCDILESFHTVSASYVPSISPFHNTAFLLIFHIISAMTVFLLEQSMRSLPLFAGATPVPFPWGLQSRGWLQHTCTHAPEDITSVYVTKNCLLGKQIELKGTYSI